MRLNVWVRSAIVATVVWLTAGTVGLHLHTMNQRADFAAKLYSFCLDGNDRLQQRYPTLDYSKQREDCSRDMNKYLASEMPWATVLFNMFIVAIVIALFTWALGFLIYIVGRWILRGRVGTVAL